MVFFWSFNHPSMGGVSCKKNGPANIRGGVYYFTSG